MKLAYRAYRPTSNWMTVLLLTLVVTGFGLFAQHRVDVAGAGPVSTPHTVLIAATGTK
ncbi:MAG TPA: hypothetical protein VJ998_09360 [Pseudomonadales bacterium]|nr:hypothetical protein [Pseudomonadales bacterium]